MIFAKPALMTTTTTMMMMMMMIIIIITIIVEQNFLLVVCVDFILLIHWINQLQNNVVLKLGYFLMPLAEIAVSFVGSFMFSVDKKL